MQEDLEQPFQLLFADFVAGDTRSVTIPGGQQFIVLNFMGHIDGAEPASFHLTVSGKNIRQFQVNGTTQVNSFNEECYLVLQPGQVLGVTLADGGLFGDCIISGVWRPYSG
jgi:hypothetical protein